MPKLQKNVKIITRPRILIVGLMGLFVGFGIISFLFHDGKGDNEVKRRKINKGADFYLKKVTFHEYQRAKQIWKMNAENARVYRDDDIAILKNVRTTLYQEDDRTIILTGRRAKIQLSSLDISIQGNIRVKSEDGTEIFAKSLHWNNKDRRVTSQESVQVVRDNIQLQGIGLELDPDKEIMTIKRRVRTLIDESNKG